MKPSIVLRMRSIVPSRYGDPKLTAKVEKTAKKLNKAIVADYNKLLKWKKKLVFEEEVTIDGTGVTNRVYTDNKIFGYLDQGTKKHFIRPKNKRALHWPGTRGSGKGAGRGRPRKPKAGYFSKGHWVSGITARNYVDTIYKQWSKKYVIEMSDIFDQALKDMEK